MRYFYFIFILFIVSCSKGEQSGLADCEIYTIDIPDPGDSTHILNLDEYYIDSICSLECPNGKEYFEVTKFMVKNGRTYIMDSRTQHTIYVFDYMGHFLFKAGERGRAKDEYIDGPTDFFVDNNNNIHVFDYVGQKIMVFDEMGKVDKVISTRDHFPYTFGLTNDNRYMYSYLEKLDHGAALAISDEDNKTLKTIIPFKHELRFLPNTMLFSQNGNRLSHLPLMSDSILVYKNSSLEKIVRVDFHGKFLMDEIPEAALNFEPDIKKNKLINYGGVQCIYEYQETDSLQYLRYPYRDKERVWLNDKNKKRIIRATSLFYAKEPLIKHYLYNNQIISLTMPYFENPMESKDTLCKSCAKVYYIRLK